MKLGVAGPISLGMLASHFSADTLPVGYVFPPMAIWVEQLISRGHQVVVFTHAPGVTECQTYYSDQLTVHVAPQRAKGRARDFFSQERRDLKAFMVADRCEVIHAHWTYEFAMAALDSGIPTLITAHDAPVQIVRHLPDPYRFARLLMAWSVSRRAPHLTAVSDYVAAHFRRYLRYRRPIAVIPNALPDSIFALAKNRPHDASMKALTVGSVLTGWNQLKNGAVALEAFSILRREIPHARFLMFGGDYAAGGPAERWAESQAMSEGVEFVGAVPYEQLLQRLASEVDILVHPSREESFGMAVAEAMALGLAVIGGAAAGAVPWLLEDGRAGELADVSSAESVANALLKLATNPELREQLGKAAFESAYKRFRSEVVFSQYENLYRQIC